MKLNGGNNTRKNNKNNKNNSQIINVDIRQIFITRPMLNIINTRNSGINTRHLSKEKNPSKQGFRLTRSNTMRTLNINSLPPVVLVPSKYGRTIDGKKEQLYEIQDGRHRIVESILLGRPTIRAKIIQ
jgi:hypothetical protein